MNRWHVRVVRPSVVFVLCFVLVGCGGGKLVKLALEQQAGGNYYQSATTLLQRLQKKPKDKKAIELLHQVGELGYKERLRSAEDDEERGRHDAALSEYRNIEEYVARVNRFGVTFPVADLESRSANIINRAAEESYQTGEKHFANANYEDAITSYRNARNYKRNYKDTTEKIAEAHYRLGEALFARNSYQNAVVEYKAAREVVANYQDTTEKIAECFYRLGSDAFGSGQYRKAYALFQDCLQTLPQYKDAAQLQATAEQKAVIRLAIIPLRNQTGVAPAGISVPDMIYDNMMSVLSERKSRFLQVIDRANIDAILAEFNLAGADFVDSETFTRRSLKGVDYVVTGKITQISVDEMPPVHETLTERKSVPLVVKAYDKYGAYFKPAGTGAATIRYTLTTMINNVQISGSIVILKVDTGDIVHTHPFSVENGDRTSFAHGPQISAPYNMNPSVSHQKLIDTSEGMKRGLFTAKKSIDSISNLTVESCKEIAMSFASTVLQRLDSDS